MANQQQIQLVVSAKDEASDILKKVGTSAKAFAATGIAITGALTLAVKAASDAEQQMSKVDVILKTMTGAQDKAREAIIKASNATTKLGFDNETAALTMTKFYQRTKDVGEALKLNSLAMDLSRAKNIDLEQAAQMVNLVMSGNARALKEYGIEIDETLGPMKSLEQLQKMVAGSSAAFTQTLEGQATVLKMQFGDMIETIGEQLIPILSQLISEYLIPMADALARWIEKNPELFKWIVIVAGAVGALAVGLGVLLGAISAVAGVIGSVGMGAFALLLGGITAITLATAKLIEHKKFLQAVIIELAKNWISAWDSMSRKLHEVVNSIMQPLSNFINKIESAISAFGKFLGISGGGGAGALGGASLVNPNKNYFSGSSLGSFANGGVIPGPLGAPQLIVAHGGERITPVSSLSAAGAGGIVVNITGNNISSELDMRDLAKKVGDEVVRSLTRTIKI